MNLQLQNKKTVYIYPKYLDTSTFAYWVILYTFVVIVFLGFFFFKISLKNTIRVSNGLNPDLKKISA